MQDSSITGDYTLPVGSILHNTYRIEQVLGKGGFAIIYQCTDLSTQNTIAIKEYFPSNLAKRECCQDLFFVQPFSATTKEFQSGHAHFLKEASILKEFRNLPGIVTVYDIFEEHNTAYIVMEYIDGPTLEQYVQTNGVLSAQEILELLFPLLRSLKKIHDKGLIHRDISPDNIILGLDNQLHLIDFGAAKMKSFDRKQQHTIILKKNYAPPEQYQISGNIGTWSDVYALCATIYFAISGHAPVPAIERLQNTPLKPISHYVNVSAHIASVIERGLSLQPSDRYKNMDDLYYAMKHPEALENHNTVIEIKEGKKVSFRNLMHIFKRPLWVVLIVFCITGGTMYVMQNTEKIQLTKKPKHPATTQASATTTEEATESPDVLTMQSVIGLKQQNAEKIIHSLDPSVQIKIKQSYDTKIKKGYVIKQSVTDGTMFNAGTIAEITLTVSRGKKTTSENSTGSTTQAEKAQSSVSPKSNATTDTNKIKKDFQIDNKNHKNKFEIK